MIRSKQLRWLFRLVLARVPVRTFFAAVILCAFGLSAFGQTDDPFSISVESNQVLVRVQVFHDRHSPAGEYYVNCMLANWRLSFTLTMSQPYVADADCVKNIEVNDLQAKDFHVFEDGVPQRISSVTHERAPWGIERDMHNERLASHIPLNEFVELHRIWSYTPRGIWRSADLPYSAHFSAVYFYRLAYVPQNLKPGACHQVKVKVDRQHAEVIATDRYCYIPHPANDILLGTELGRSLETELSSHFIDPEIPLSAQAGFFYSDTNEAKIEIVLSFPFEKLKHSWRSEDFHGNIGILGMAYATDGTVSARFSDAAIVRGDLFWSDTKDRSMVTLPSRYETQLDLPPGTYNLRIALSDGSKFGRVEIPVQVDSYGGKKLTLSSVFLFKRFRNAGVAAQEAAKINLAPAYVPLVSEHMEITPTADPTFHPKEMLPAYVELYEPLLAKAPDTTVQLHMRIVDGKNGKVKRTFPWFDVAPYRRSGMNKFAVHRFLDCGALADGEYRLEVQAKDSAGRSTQWQSAGFKIASR